MRKVVFKMQKMAFNFYEMDPWTRKIFIFPPETLMAYLLF